MKYIAPERIDANKESHALRKAMHLNRYHYAASHIKSLKRKKGLILDLACGTGYGSNLMQKMTGYDVFGGDISTEAITYANKHYKNKSVSFAQTDLRKLKQKNNSSDFVVSFETIEHVPYDDGGVDNALDHIWRVLKPGGRLIMSSPNRLFTAIMHGFNMQNPYHFREFMPGEFGRLLERHKLKVVERVGQTCYFPLTFLMAKYGMLSQSYFYPTAKLPPILAVNFIYIAEKVV